MRKSTPNKNLPRRRSFHKSQDLRVWRTASLPASLKRSPYTEYASRSRSWSPRIASKRVSPRSTGVGTFTERVFRVVATIPRGNILTYKQVAQRAGSPRAYRAVGNILNQNYNPNIPCHRVIRSDGEPGGYNRGREKKKLLLKEEQRDRTLTHDRW